MKKASFFSLLMAACLFTPCSYSEQVWVNSVNENHGWLDYEKTPQEYDGDDLPCWASSASCIIDYWQGLYITSSTIPTGSAIWERFKEASVDKGGNQIYAIQWWLGGNYAIPDTYPGSITTSPQAAHMKDFLWFGYGWLDDFSTTLINRISSAPIGLAIVDTNNQLGHTITLRGVEYENDTISKVWITDSDDSTHTIREFETGTITTKVSNIEGTFITLKDYINNEKYGDVFNVQSY